MITNLILEIFKFWFVFIGKVIRINFRATIYLGGITCSNIPVDTLSLGITRGEFKKFYEKIEHNKFK